ncbi:MAG: hypothetical protein ACSHXZ_09445 [Gammaproteobacteria bacterium]
MKLKIISLNFAFLLWSQAALSQGTAASEFEYYQSMLKSNSSVSFVANRLDQDDLFEKLEGSDTWVRTDSNGHLSISLRGDAGATITYSPSETTPYGDTALAALIDKSNSMIVSEANLLELRFDYAGFSQYLSFSLSSGSWTKTSVSIQW